MWGDFRKVFCPTKEELLEQKEMALNIHNELIGSCSTCKHYKCVNNNSISYDDYCMKGCKDFKDKVFSRETIKCDEYEENGYHIKLENEIKELRLENERD